MTHPLDLPVAEIASRVASGDVSAEALATESLRRIDASRSLNAFLHVANERALEAARAVDVRRAKGEPLGPLAGVPIAVKDALCTSDQPTTCASKILVRAVNGAPAATPEGGFRPPYDATVVERLRRAGAVLVGKANMDEFAMGSSNENSAFGPVRNPWDPTRTPGGSSGGSAASVAARLVAGSLGSDTGGSIRQPAGLTGVVGVKPTYGRVSRYGLIAFASSLDQVGPFAPDVASAARLLEVLAGPDPRDSTASPTPVGRYEAACQKPVKGLRIGVPREYFAEGLDAEVEASVRAAIDALKGEGCTVQEVDMPHTRYGLATYYIVATAEASSNLARFDGVRFGLRMEKAGADLQTMYAASRGAGFGPEVKRRIMLGTYALAAGYYDAYYKKAQQVRTLIKRDFDEAFAKVDVLLTPISPTPAFKLGDKLDDPVKMYLSDVYTLPASLAGVCALSVPCAASPATADRPTLPIGLQVIARSFDEETMFQVAAAWSDSPRPEAPDRRLRRDEPAFDVASVTAAHGEALAALFVRSGVSCYCRYWHFHDTANAWLGRSAHQPEQSRAELLAALGAGSAEATGVVALDGHHVIGWLKLAPVAVMSKLYAQRPYRRLPCFDGPREGVFVVGCLLVDPSWRHRGVADALLGGALLLAAERGARAVEAFPRRAEGTRDEDVWMGPHSMFVRAGFEIVNDFGPYPVLRRTLTP